MPTHAHTHTRTYTCMLALIYRTKTNRHSRQRTYNTQLRSFSFRIYFPIFNYMNIDNIVVLAIEINERNKWSIRTYHASACQHFSTSNLFRIIIASVSLFHLFFFYLSSVFPYIFIYLYLWQIYKLHAFCLIFLLLTLKHKINSNDSIKFFSFFAFILIVNL